MNDLTLPQHVKTIGQAVRWARRARRWTIAECAVVVGVPEATVSRVEVGFRYASLVPTFEAELGVKLAHLPFVARKCVRPPRVKPAPIAPKSVPANTLKAAPSPPSPPPSKLAETFIDPRTLPNLPTPRMRRKAEGREDYGAQPWERQLIAGERSESSRCYSGCNACHDMPWRRRKVGGCIECGEPYEPEAEVHAIADQRSHAGYVADQGLPPAEQDSARPRRKRQPKAA